jgi:hypothetical protein
LSPKSATASATGYVFSSNLAYAKIEEPDRRNRENATSALPITLKVARQVGDIFRYVPDGTTPDPRYRFYM